MSDIRAFVLKLIEKKAKLPKDADVDTFNYIDTGYVDSLGIMKFVLDIEAEYDIEITDDDMTSDRFRTVGGIISLIEEKLALRGNS